MKNLLTFILTLALSTTVFAQQPMNSKDAKAPANDAYNTQMQQKADAQFQKYAAATLALTEGERGDFEAFFTNYREAQESLTARRRVLVQQYREEMREDDSVKDETGETADFIENYWELDIAAMELKKDHFDKLEDKIGPMRALAFFGLEDAFQARMQRRMLMRAIPALVVLEPARVSYQTELDDFNDWKTINIDGKMDLDHEFTSKGLHKLVTAAEAMTATDGIMVKDFDQRKAMIMEKATALKEDWKSLKHADYARQAFTATADLLTEIAGDRRFTARTAWTDRLQQTAKRINPAEKLTKQSATVYEFFDLAETIVNDLSRQTNRSASATEASMRR